MAFQIRKTAPESSNKCYTTTAYGGWNKCITGNPQAWRGSALANCVGYAYGRSLEIMRQCGMNVTSCSMPTCNAGDWLTANTAYKSGKTPKVGAVAVFAPNHVAVVEKIENGVCTLSESGWGGPKFHYGNTISKAKGYNDHNWGGYTLKGFIYNPATITSTDDEVRGAFIQEAKKHVGEGGQWTWSTYGVSNIEWCAAFVSAVAKTVGIVNKCIVNTALASSHSRLGVSQSKGTFYKGPAQGIKHKPEVGDLVFFRWKPAGWSDMYDCSHVEIVTQVNDNNTFKCIGGNTGTNNKLTSKVAEHTYNWSNSSQVSGYFNPDWSLARDVDTTSYTEVVVPSELYNTENTRQDMTIREVAYLNETTCEPSINSSKITLSVINYTTLLADMFRELVPEQTITVTGGTAYPEVGELTTKSGKKPALKKTVVVPTSLAQTGIIRNYTNYTYWYSRWAKNTTQRKLADIWNNKGRKSSRNIATIDSYYLLAMSPKFATTGDIVAIHLENGDIIKAILADAKGSDATSPWGHQFGSAVDIVEWESVGAGQSGSTRIELGTWENKKVVKVDNYGQWLD